MNNLIIYALVATLGTWFVTALGAGTVVFFKSPGSKVLNLMLGFASGVMIAASFWSLLQPAIERAEEYSALPAYFVATVGFLFGAVFMWSSDKIVTFSRRKVYVNQGTHNEHLNRVIMLVLSITLHNIPEGLAVGVAFGALQGDNFSPEKLMGAITIAVGIGLQNFPEGAAISAQERGLFPNKKLSHRAGVGTCRADCGRNRSACRNLHSDNSAVRLILRGGMYDTRCGSRAYPRMSAE